MIKGVVAKSTGSWYITKTDEGKFINSRIKGVFKIDGITSTNPLAVGDVVELEIDALGTLSNTIVAEETDWSILDRKKTNVS